jgi:Leucine-rich repeat (LRR) protein
MSYFHRRLKRPEEIELELKQRELGRYRDELTRWQQTITALKAEIRDFEQLYQVSLGSRITLREELEWQVNGILGAGAAEAEREAPPGEQVGASHRITDLLDDDPEFNILPPDIPHKSLKSLYRGVAKAVHPDLASSEQDRTRRQELMSLANQAYESGNRQILEELFFDWELATPGLTGSNDVAGELVRVIRMIARVRENIHALTLQIDELKQTDIYRFMLRVEDARADGVDLLAEMAARLDGDIARFRRRLSVLRGEQAVAAEDGNGRHPVETRAITFPNDRSCGMLYLRPEGSLDYREWQWVGGARGIKEIPLGKEVRLDIKGNGEGLGFLDVLQPEELQALFLNDVDDAALDHVLHLTGLQELCLNNTIISEAGLARLRGLCALQRLYLYQTPVGDNGLFGLLGLTNLKWLTCSGTGITEEGLHHFRQQMPGCRVVNFKWRYMG